jgi:hypothetical protein
MTSYLRPAVAFPPFGTGADYWTWRGYPYWRNPEIMARSRTPWARFWISWYDMMPRGFRDPATDTELIPGKDISPQQYMNYIVSQIQSARRDGKHVILTFHQTPFWANSTTWSDRAATTQDAKLGQLYCPPDDDRILEWGYTVRYLTSMFNRYAPTYPDAWVEFLEISNEPNLSWTGQRHADGRRKDFPFKAAAMIAWARDANRLTYDEPVILAPGLSDTRRDEPANGLWDFRPFMDQVLAYLRSNTTFSADRRVGWSMHNYGDIKYGFYGSDNNAVIARDKLGAMNFWPPSPADPTPYVMLTEGGALMNWSEVGGSETRQADLVANNWQRMYSYHGTAMITNYLLWSDPTYDSGMCEVNTFPPSQHPGPALGYDNGTIRRIVDRWAGLPSTAPR